MKEHQPIPLSMIQTAQARLNTKIFRTPLIPVILDNIKLEIFLKLENLQPLGSFKIRGAGNAILSAGREQLNQGVWTASAGNMALAVAWYARSLQIPCTVIVPDDAPAIKIQNIDNLNAHIIRVPFSEYQKIQCDHYYSEIKGLLIHPFGDESVMAGNGTIGLEILEDLPDVDAIIVPYGGGGLSCGIASAVKAISPKVKVYAAEVATATPLASSLASGAPIEVTYTPSFVSGMGAPFVFPEMWRLASQLLDGSLVVEIDQVVSTIRLMAERQHIIAEGAGAVALAAALHHKLECKKIACVVSGGNIDRLLFTKILQENSSYVD